MSNNLASRALIDKMPGYPAFDVFDLHTFIPKAITVAIYGVGTRGTELFNFITANLEKIKIHCFVDSTTPGEKLGLPVVTPDALLAMPEVDLVIVASTYNEQIVGVLKFLGIASYIVFSDAKRMSATFLKRRKKRIAEFGKRLETDDDRKLLELILDYRNSYKKSVEHFSDFKNTILSFGFGTQYLDFINKEVIRVVYDCGSYVGDTALDFLKLPNIKTVYCFDPYNGADEAKKYSSVLAADPRVKFYKVGLCDRVGLKYGATNPVFMPGAALRDRRDRDHESAFQCTSIDELAEDDGIESPDFIKMDVEGFELKALRGAVETIKSKRMQFAVCIYHKENDLYELFEFLDTHCPNYVYRLGHYMPTHITELVLYAIPRELYTQ